MKLILILATAFFLAPVNQSGFYNLSVADIEGNTVPLSSFQDRKIVFSLFGAGAPQPQQLRFLDSLQTANPSVKFIAVPAEEFAGPGQSQALRNLRNAHCPGVLMTAPMLVTKGSGLNQHPVFQWLTDVNRNAHFDNDAAAGQLFMVAPGAKLYSVLAAGAPTEVIQQTLQQTIN